MTRPDRIEAPQSPFDEAAIVRGITSGDRNAFERLMRRYNRRLYRLARAVLHDDAEAEDVLQDAYLSAFRLIGQFRGEAALSTWLSRLVLNEALGRLRRDARRRNVIPMLGGQQGDGERTVESSSLPDRELARTQIRALLERKLDELPESFRMVFVLRSIEELSVSETAQCLNIPEATVRSRYFRARSLLREELAQELELDLLEQDLYDFGGARCDRVTAAVMARL